jgi:thymidylate synthase (FAD)
MGNDDSIVQAARISYNSKGYQEDPKKTRHLIRYLFRNKHTSPFEMVEFKFHVKAPLYVARQWLRHRTASVNEVSARYTELKDEFYIPDPVRKQSTVNHQGSNLDDPFTDDENTKFSHLMNVTCENSFKSYKELLGEGMAKEVARSCIPVNTFTEFYWKINLHNLFHFLKLRISDHAQLEISQLAKEVYEIIKPIVPMSCEAFEDYTLNSLTLSGPEIEAIRTKCIDKLSTREQTELREKWVKIFNEDYPGASE